MTVAYLVAAHDNPGHLRRLIGALSSPSSKCFVHIDRKSDIKKFHGLRRGARPAPCGHGGSQALRSLRAAQRRRLSPAIGGRDRAILRAEPGQGVHQPGRDAGGCGGEASLPAHDLRSAPGPPKGPHESPQAPEDPGLQGLSRPDRSIRRLDVVGPVPGGEPRRPSQGPIPMGRGKSSPTAPCVYNLDLVSS